MLVIPAFGDALPAVMSPNLGGVRDLLGPLGLAAYLGSGPGGWGRRSLLLPSRSA
jgi:hypothetical protein